MNHHKIIYSKISLFFRSINNNYIEGLKKFSELENEDEFKEAEHNDEEYIKCLKKFMKEYESAYVPHGEC